MDHAPVPIVADYMTPGPDMVGADESLARAYARMQEHGIRHLPVLRGTELVGVLSERDVHLAQSLTPERGYAEELTVEDAMTPDPYVVAPQAPLNHVARVMGERRIGSAIVVEHGGIAGVFTVTDALVALVEALEGTFTRRTYEGVTTAPREPRRVPDLR